MVFDLDPGPPAQVLDCAEVALWLRDFFAKKKLQCFCKTSGSKGLQVYVPLNTPISFEQTKSYARSLAELLTGEHPERVVFRMEKQLRKGKVLIDWSQNDSHKTTVAVYSLRAREHPTVSTPVTWEELQKAQRAQEPDRLRFETQEVLRRVDKFGDLFAAVLKLKQKLPQW